MVPHLSTANGAAVARPALSAARGFEIIDVFAASPSRGMTMSDVARATGINTASCHAVLTVMVERGYLLRDLVAKTYALGPMAHAAGQAALIAQPLLARARDAASDLNAELALPVMISAPVGGDVVGIVAIGDTGDQPPLLRVGERRALVPPVGAPFVTWAGDAAIAAWLDRDPSLDGDVRETLRRAALAIRERGFEVLLRSPAVAPLASEIRAFAGDGAGFRLGPDMVLPGTIDAEQDYTVTMIAAPVFDRQGACAFNLCLGPFAGPLRGSDILGLAERLLRACVQVMHADRAAA
jgi:DNA-binding IclR family transcriptional regulator